VIIMSEHAWVLENLACYVAGGLSAEEHQRLESHVAECASCAQALEELRSVDGQMEDLFAAARPDAALEDRSIQALRELPPRRRKLRFFPYRKLMWAVAAAVLAGCLGAGLTQLESLPFPGADPQQTSDGGNLAPAAPKGMKAVAIRVSTEGIAGSWAALPGSRVDIVSTVRRGSDDDSFSQVLLEDVLVLAADGWNKTSEGGGALPASVVTLALPAEDALKVKFGSQIGPLHLMLRKEGDKSHSTKEKVNIPQIIRGRADKGASLDKDEGFQKLNQEPLNPKLDIPAIERSGDGLARDGSRNGEESKLHRLQLGYFKPGEVFSTAKHDGETKFSTGERLTDRSRDAVRFDVDADKAPERKARALEEVAQKEGRKVLLGAEEQAKKDHPPEPTSRKIIRTGEIDFEVDSFDAAVAVVTRLVSSAQGGFIATVNSEKLPNGKVRGSVVVRLPPEKLDGFVLDLRKDLAKMGELKSQRIGSQDITKQYTDLESRLRAARTMEERLLKIMKEGKGQIKDLLQVEKELSEWRTRIEQVEGELRYYAHQVALSTLTITLTEKEIRQAAVVTDNERVQAGIQVEDVEKAFRAAQDTVSEAKGRVIKSELKQHSAGQFVGLLHFEVEAAEAGVVRDRLRQLGTVVRFDIDRVQQAEGGVLGVKDGKVKRGPTQFVVSLYNVANVAPRDTVLLKVAAKDVPAAYRKIREAVEKAQGRVKKAELDQQEQQAAGARLEFDIRRTAGGALQAALADAGEVLSRKLNRQPPSENVTDVHILFDVELVDAQTIPPREATTLTVEVTDVDAAQAVLAAQVQGSGGRIRGPTIGVEPNGRITSQVTYLVPLTAAPGLLDKIRSSGRVRQQTTAPDEQAPAGKLALAKLGVTWTNSELLVPGNEGLGAQLQRGLAFSLRGLALSASWLLVGVLVVLPWLLLIYVVVLLIRRLWRRRTATN
jgi:hypothetical protein